MSSRLALRGGRPARVPGRAGGASERRGLAWMIGAFVVCPCHLPLTLAALVAVLGGTAVGAVVREHVVLAGILVSTVWVLGTARGIYLLRRPAACPIPDAAARPLEQLPPNTVAPEQVRAVQDTVRP